MQDNSWGFQCFFWASRKRYYYKQLLYPCYGQRTFCRYYEPLLGGNDEGVQSLCALNALDENCNDYINFTKELPKTVTTAQGVADTAKESGASALQTAIIKGLKEQSASLTAELLKTQAPLDIVQGEIIPALDTVGVGFENKTIYLPQLLISAEAAKAAFEVIKNAAQSTESASKCTFIIATVEGDIHDIGKNIVKLLLQNYGFNVTDLGRDVPPEVVAQAAVDKHADIVGLSALMTTTVPAMEKTIKLLRDRAPWCKVIVGGAVLNEEYANTIGADKYAKDAMETVRYAEKINILS